MRHDRFDKVIFVLAESDYSELIQLLDDRIKSERGRAAAFKGRHDHSNLIIAKAKWSRLLDLRNAVVSGCRQEVGDV